LRFVDPEVELVLDRPLLVEQPRPSLVFNELDEKASATSAIAQRNAIAKKTVYGTVQQS
jgi:hypothetical protein